MKQLLIAALLLSAARSDAEYGPWEMLEDSQRNTLKGLNWYSPYQNQLGFRLNSTLFDNKEWPSTLLHGQISASRTALFFRIITISMFTFTD